MSNNAVMPTILLILHSLSRDFINSAIYSNIYFADFINSAKLQTRQFDKFGIHIVTAMVDRNKYIRFLK